MKVWQGALDAWGVVDSAGTAVSIGVFDGVHRGHQAVLSVLVEEASGLGLTAAVLTFDRHPLSLVAPERAPKMLTTVEQRLEHFEQLGVGLVGVLPFAEIRRLHPDQFARRVLGEHLRARLVRVGADFRYGLDRSGDPSSLGAAGAELAFEVEVVPLLTDGDDPVSSAGIRRLVADGRVEDAADALGHPFELRGRVVPGDGRGRTIGIPTANLEVPSGMVVPGGGVYAAWAVVNPRSTRFASEALPIHREEVPSVVNVGVRPTFGGERLVVEAHLLDFDRDLYGEELALAFVARLREERRFESVEALVGQIRRDIEVGRDRLEAVR